MTRRRPRVLSAEDAAAALVAAEQTAARWAAEVEQMAHEAERLAAELAEEHASAAERVLDADEPDEGPQVLARISAELARKEAEQVLAVQTAERAAERLVAARRDVVKALAASVRTRAVRLQGIGTARQAKTDQMVAELAEWESVRFGPAPLPSASGVGAAMQPRTLTQQVLGRAQWLMGHAEHLDRVADEGPADQVTSVVNAGEPELVPAEVAVAAESVAV